MLSEIGGLLCSFDLPFLFFSLGQILGVASLIILVFYIFGISWKLFKIHRGTYVEEEPVFYKYK